MAWAWPGEAEQARPPASQHRRPGQRARNSACTGYCLHPAPSPGRLVRRSWDQCRPAHGWSGIRRTPASAATAPPSTAGRWRQASRAGLLDGCGAVHALHFRPLAPVALHRACSLNGSCHLALVCGSCSLPPIQLLAGRTLPRPADPRGWPPRPPTWLSFSALSGTMW